MDARDIEHIDGGRSGWNANALACLHVSADELKVAFRSSRGHDLCMADTTTRLKSKFTVHGVETFTGICSK